MVLSPLEKFFTWGIYTSVHVFFNFFNEVYLPLCKLTKMVFSTLENVLYPKNIHLSARVIQFFSMQNIYPCSSWRKCIFYTWKCYLPIEYIPLYECFDFFSMKNIYLCANWLKWGLLYLKLFHTQKIYTSVRVFFNHF